MKASNLTRIKGITSWLQATPGICGLLLILLLMLGLLTANVMLEYRQATEKAIVTTENMARVLALQLEADFERTDGVLRSVEQMMTLLEQAHGLDHRVNDSTLALAELIGVKLEVFKRSFPDLGSINIFDAEGKLRYSSEPNLSMVDIADRPHFQILKTDPHVDISISSIITARTTGQRSLAQLRALRTADGEFRGVVGAVIDPERIDRLLASLDTGPGGVAVIRRSDTTALIARAPRYNEADFNQPLPPDSLSRQRVMAGERSDYMSYIASTDGEPRLGSFQRLENYPFYAQVALSRNDYLAGWRLHVQRVVALALLLILGFVVVLRRLAHSHQVAEAALAEAIDSREQYASLVDNIPGITYRCHNDADWTMQFLSGQVAQYLGYRPEELLNNQVISYNQLIVAEDRQRVADTITHATAHGQAWELEYQLCHKNGNILWVYEKGRAIVDPQSQVRYLDGFVIDITERKRQADEIENFFTVNLDLLCIANLDGYLLKTNTAWEHTLGYSAAELQQRPFIELVHPDDVAATLEAMANLGQGDTVVGFTNRFRCRDGSYRYIEWLSRPKGHLIYAAARDMTERQTLENSLKQAQTELQRSERLLMDGETLAKIGGWEYQVASRKMFWTQGLFTLHGVKADPDLDCINDSIRCYLAEDREKIFNAFQACVDHGQSYDLVFPFMDYQQQHKWIRTKTEPVIEQGQVTKVVGIVMDITEQKQAELRLQATLSEAERLKTAAEAANVAKSRFLATMSHELRTPMNAILGMAQLLLAAPRSPAQTQDYARTILNAGQSLLTLLNDILDLSKIEAGKLTLEDGVVEPAQMLHEIQSLFSSVAQDQGVTLDSVGLEHTSQRYRGDPHRLRQMLNNLVNNALKFTHQGAVRIDARVAESQETHDILEFAVTDTGIGIAPEHQDRLFQAFSQVDDSMTRQFGGTGLGLSIVRRLAAAMDGEVGVDSSPGEGSRFWFRVRLERLPEGSDTRTQPRTAIAASEAWSTGRVLIVEDHPDNQVVISEILQQHGMQTVLAANGQLGVERFIAEAERIDLILMDVQMPVLDGYAATQQIRAWEREQQRSPIPIIALTADAFPEDRQRCLDAGMDNYLSKPLDFKALTALLAQYAPTTHRPEAEAAARPAAQSTAVDWVEFTAQVQALLPLLEQSQFDALQQFAELESHFEHTPLAEDLAALRSPLNAFRFRFVQERLEQMIAEHTR